jgi:hypothetical protein
MESPFESCEQYRRTFKHRGLSVASHTKDVESESLTTSSFWCLVSREIDGRPCVLTIDLHSLAICSIALGHPVRLRLWLCRLFF